MEKSDIVFSKHSCLDQSIHLKKTMKIYKIRFDEKKIVEKDIKKAF